MVAAAWLTTVLVLTLRPDPGAAAAVAESPWHCLACGQAGTADLVVNLLLFVPLGIALQRAGVRGVATTVLIAGCSLLIELLQGLVIAGRDMALGDLVANVLGGGAGWLVAARFVGTIPVAAPIAALGIFAAQLLATAWFAAPIPVEAGRTTPRIAPVIPGRAWYPGSVVGWTVDGNRLQGEASDEAAMASTGMAVAFTWSEPLVDAVYPVARLEDARGWAVAAVGQAAEEVVLSMQTRAGAWRLRTPTWRAPLASPARVGDTVAANLTIASGSARVTTIVGDSVRAETIRFGAQHGWLLFHPWAPHGSEAQEWSWWTAAWLIGWGALLGFVAARRRPLWWGIAAVSFLAVATTASGAPATPAEYLALALGLVGGIRTGAPRRPPASA